MQNNFNEKKLLRISLITPTYNSGLTIRSTLQSVADQKYSNLQYIIIDSASTDHTLSIVNEYSDIVTDIVSEKDNGIYYALNKGIAMSDGDIIGILNSDDFYVTNNVLDQVSDVFTINNDCDVVMANVDYVESNDLKNPLRNYKINKFYTWMFRFGIMPPHPAVFVKKSAYNRVGKFNTDFKIAADFDFLVRLLYLHLAKFVVINQIWVRMRIGGISTASIKSNLIITQEIRRSLNINSISTNYFFILMRIPYKLFYQIIYQNLFGVK